MATASLPLCRPSLSAGKRRRAVARNPVAGAPKTGQADHAHLALAGKSIGATSSQPPPVHQLSGYEGATGMVLCHGHVEQKANEISALKPRLTAEWLPGRILTLDAMHTRASLVGPSPAAGRRLPAAGEGHPASLVRGESGSVRLSARQTGGGGKRPKRGTKGMDG